MQDVDGLKPSKYLIKTAKRNIEGEISAAEARKLVDEYNETKINHDVPADAEEADKVAARITPTVSLMWKKHRCRWRSSSRLKRRGGRKNGEWYFEKAKE